MRGLRDFFCGFLPVVLRSFGLPVADALPVFSTTTQRTYGKIMVVSLPAKLQNKSKIKTNHNSGSSLALPHTEGYAYTKHMRIGRPFQIKGIANSEDTFVPLTVRCVTCKKLFKIKAIEIWASDIYGSRTLECMTCTDVWLKVMEALGSEHRDPTDKLVHVKLELPIT